MPTSFDYMNIVAQPGNSVSHTGFSTEGNSSGTFDYQYSNDGTAIYDGFSQSWLTSTPDTSFAAQHEIRWTSVSGTSENTLVQNTWYALSSPRTFLVSGVQGVVDNLIEITIEIRKIGTTTPVYSATHSHNILGTG